MPYMSASCKYKDKNPFLFVLEKFSENTKIHPNFSLKSALANFLLALTITLSVFTLSFSNLSPAVRDPAKDAE